MRQIVLDTETTGLEVEQQHRVIEIGCVELVNRRLTGRTYHQYLNPERDIDEGAQQVHGLSRETLAKEPTVRADACGVPGVHPRRGAHHPQRAVRRRLPECRTRAHRASAHRSATPAGCSTPWRSRARCIPASATVSTPCASATRSTIRIATITARCSTRASSPRCISP